MSLVCRVDSVGGQSHGLYIGGKSDAKSRDWIEKNGISHILNVTPPKEAGNKTGIPNYFAKTKRIVYKRVPVFDDTTANLLEHADSVVRFISTGLIHGSVLVHCRQGVSRSATCIAFYLMRKKGMTMEESLSLLTSVRRGGVVVKPNAAFRLQLQTYETRGRKEGWIHDGATVSRTKRKGPELPHTQKETTTKRGRKRIGPSMPPTEDAKRRQIGPALPNPSTATNNNVDSAPSSSPRKSVIGPAMPPGFQQESQGQGSEEPSERQKSLPSSLKERVIGPAMPPGFQSSKDNEQPSESQDSLPPSPKERAIGPAMLPGFQSRLGS